MSATAAEPWVLGTVGILLWALFIAFVITTRQERRQQNERWHREAGEETKELEESHR